MGSHAPHEHRSPDPRERGDPLLHGLLDSGTRGHVVEKPRTGHAVGYRGRGVLGAAKHGVQHRGHGTTCPGELYLSCVNAHEARGAKHARERTQREEVDVLHAEFLERSLGALRKPLNVGDSDKEKAVVEERAPGVANHSRGIEQMLEHSAEHHEPVATRQLRQIGRRTGSDSQPMRLEGYGCAGGRRVEALQVGVTRISERREKRARGAPHVQDRRVSIAANAAELTCDQTATRPVDFGCVPFGGRILVLGHLAVVAYELVWAGQSIGKPEAARPAADDVIRIHETPSGQGFKRLMKDDIGQVRAAGRTRS